MNAPKIQWYPGHIAKAERQLKKNLSKVDLVIEVRDARIPIASSHARFEKWTTGKKHILVINRQDMIIPEDKTNWHKWFKEKNLDPLWCNAKSGIGISRIKQAAIQSGYEINKRRVFRGMQKRPIRALLLGFPNVGKSALINRLVDKKVAASSRRAGVTKSLQWVRIGNEIDLLDAPGILPPKIDDQDSAILLAICDDIGEASYDNEIIATKFLKILEGFNNKYINNLNERYGIEYLQNNNGYDWLKAAANIHTSSDTNRMAQRLLDDFRKKFLGKISLEKP